MSKIGETVPFKPRPGRRRNLTEKKYRHRTFSWTTWHTETLNIIIEKFPVRLNFRSKTNKGYSVANTNAFALTRLFVEWLEENTNGMPEEFFQSTPYGEAIKWWKNLQGQAYGKDAKKVVEDSYGVENDPL
jgi:hypothetical protein